MDGQSDTDHPDPALMEQAIDRGKSITVVPS
jgi:hypothetical protein